MGKEIELLHRAAQTANWADNICHQVAFSTPPPFESTEVYPGQRVWLSRALLSLTREELLRLYDTTLKEAREEAFMIPKRDWTPQCIRDRHPHVYGENNKELCS